MADAPAPRAAVGDTLTVDGMTWTIYALGVLNDGTPAAFANSPGDPGAVTVFALAAPAWLLAPEGPMQ